MAGDQVMTQDEYLRELASQVDPDLVEKFRDWPTETKLYMYLHHIQLAHMARFEHMLKEHTLNIAALNSRPTVNAVSTTWIEP
jgi:hypothetical protein